MNNIKMLFLFFSILLIGLSVPQVAAQENYLTNGDFTADVTTGWTLIYDDDTNMLVVPDSGAAKLHLLPTTSGSNKHHFYQSFPVVAGKYYQLSGKWKGDLNSGQATGARGWVELEIAFDTKAVADIDAGIWDVKYKKRYDSDVPEDLMYVDSSGEWDWDEITDAPNGDNIPAYDVGFEVPEGMTYMFVSVNIGVRNTDVITTADDVKLWIDDLAVRDCQGDMNGADINGDCAVDLQDFAVLAGSWLKCNLDPTDACEG